MALVVLIFLFWFAPFSAALEGNPSPCLRAKHNNAHNVFLKRHLPDGVPKTWDQNAWQNLLRNIKTCDRPTQSFFHASEREHVNRVCSEAGGKAQSGNLCVSKQKFSFVTVRVDVGQGTCGIRNVRNETKHIILACDQIGDDCLPVHFQANPEGLGPDNNQLDCGPGSRGKSVVAAAPGGALFVFVVLALLFVF